MRPFYNAVLKIKPFKKRYLIKRFCMAIIKAVTTACFAGLFLIAAGQEMTDYRGPVFPSNHALNTRIDNLPVHPNSANFINTMGANTRLHPDFGTAWDDDGVMRQMGIPYNIVGAAQPLVPITFVYYPDESDPGPWPIPGDPYIETVFDWRDTDDGDRHMLIIDSSNHMLYETGNVYGNSTGTAWEGGCGAVFDLTSNDLRPASWTSADAAGLPIFPLLIRYDEVERALANGTEIPHAIRVTAQQTQRQYVWPARHYASSSTDPNRPPMGLRFRLKSDFNISGFSPRMQVILRTLKKYGFIVADNGSNWYFQGTHDDRWDDEELNSLKTLRGNNFEAVDVSEWFGRAGFNINSAAVPGTSTDIPDHTRQPVLFCQNHPNPFHQFTTIYYMIPGNEKARIRIYNNLGSEINCLEIKPDYSGLNSIQWDGTDASGNRLQSGLYFYRLEYENMQGQSQKIMLY